jgi:ribosomal protein L12E/L44/L45/RPP1/RPP2
MDQNYILKLAIEELQRQKAGIEAEIEEIEMIRAELSKSGSSATIKKGKTPVVAAASAGRKRSRTAAEKKAQSEKMRKYWAAKRSAAKK